RTVGAHTHRAGRTHSAHLVTELGASAHRLALHRRDADGASDTLRSVHAATTQRSGTRRGAGREQLATGLAWNTGLTHLTARLIEDVAARGQVVAPTPVGGLARGDVADLAVLAARTRVEVADVAAELPHLTLDADT